MPKTKAKAAAPSEKQPEEVTGTETKPQKARTPRTTRKAKPPVAESEGGATDSVPKRKAKGAIPENAKATKAAAPKTKTAAADSQSEMVSDSLSSDLATSAEVTAQPESTAPKASRKKAAPKRKTGNQTQVTEDKAEQPAESSTQVPKATSKNRKSTRGRKAASQTEATSEAEAALSDEVSATATDQAASEQTEAAAVPALSETPNAEAIPSDEAQATLEEQLPAAKPKRTTRRTTKRSEPAADAVGEQADTDTAASATQTSRTKRSRRGRKADTTTEQAETAVAVSEPEGEAPVTLPQTVVPGLEPDQHAEVQAGASQTEEGLAPGAEVSPEPVASTTQRSRRSRKKTAETISDEPLVLQRSKSKGKKAGSKSRSRQDENLEADLGRLSGVEPVEPLEPGSAPTAQLGDLPEISETDVLAALLPDLPPAPQATATATTPETVPEDPVQDLLLRQLRSIGRPIHVKDLEKSFTRQKADLVGNWRDIEGVLEDLTRAGMVIRTRKKTYGLPEAMNLVRGRFQASAAGFGFVVPDSGREDYYVSPEDTMEAWNGDTVLVRPEGHGSRGSNSGRRGSRFDGNPQASVVRIVERNYAQLVGTLEFSHGYPILKPDDFRARHRILLLAEEMEGLSAGARVVVDLYWPEDTGEDEVFGQVSRVLGEEDDPETETEAVMVKYGLRGEFPPEVVSEAERIPREIPDSALRGRLDLRELNTFTVDGRDAKDFDDAIHIAPTERGTFMVGIHIADVSHYVKAGSPLDQEAYARATSVYLPGRVLPMLPEHLSNGVCSLVPLEDRLTMSALVELSADAEILSVEIGPSVIHSKARLTYDEVQAYSEATSPLPEHARHLEGDLHLLLKFTTKLRQKRLREGSLDFKMREVKVDVDAEGRMELIPLREETARGMIEDLMLLANKVVARFLLERRIPTLFRIHEEPTLQRFQDVSQAIGRLGLAFPGGEPTPQAYQDVLKQVRGTPRESVVNSLLLRSMQQAKYAGENLGHFGLAFDEYLHFTSPIRRYPDLMVHRVLREVLAGELRTGSREVDQLRSVLPTMGEHTSDRERNAAEAERDLTKYYQAKWAQAHEGLSFMGSVSGVVASGLFVALENGVEGKLHISNLDDDYYIYLEDAQMLKGRSNGRTFKLGDSVPVTINEVKPLARQIDFTVPEEGTELEEIVMSDQQPSGNKTQASGQKVRARRREDREQERQQKLSNVQPTQPRFTLDDEGSTGSQRHQNQGRRPARSEGRDTRAEGSRSNDGRQQSRRRDGGQQGGGRAGNGGGRRRVITLERPRNEHLRPVNITVQRMYFGDWTVENMPEEGHGPQDGGRPDRGGYSRGQHSGGNRGRQAQGGPGGRGRSGPGQPQGQGQGEGDKRRRRSRRRRSEGQQGG
ncbi:ribonuclease R [Deinococcus radiophilus]|uniref:Ribonuclease R n=1 Tax=Deinococcus radiophilus TaxID=32062 RepID=A0A431VUA8_9DEIO|nr:ribonuclease R [Deinococcus radiophilus]RTR26691.1 ribonuclease R [Deinococcus radiophilus]